MSPPYILVPYSHGDTERIRVRETGMAVGASRTRSDSCPFVSRRVWTQSLVLDGTLITTRDTTRFTPAHYVRESRKEGRMTDRREARPAWSIR